MIPVLNDGEMLRRVLADLAAQTRPADELIVVDNGSTDDTGDVARGAGAIVLLQPVKGIMSAAATGYDAATGDVIARLDADSRPYPDWLERIEREFDSSPAIGVLTGPGDFYGARAWVNWIAEHLYIGAYFNVVGPWLTNVPVFGSNFAMRRSVWQETSPLVHRDTPHVHDDLDLALHLPLDVVTRYDHTLRVGVSARPFDSWSGLWQRVAWAFVTFKLHWPDASPWARRAARRRLFRAEAAKRQDYLSR
ncbi:glycosyltransferase family 2 protein [Gryllotalpicola sp.]|uniref:glycosyltransferase family 2 protein n=1 Tax=Gryllotalpicola sp. TaxID=1932787 RepID=UPI00260A4AF4|nr:glycosyltransferase family 2 protein [Gryllotalpicola sp.]